MRYILFLLFTLSVSAFLTFLLFNLPYGAFFKVNSADKVNFFIQQNETFNSVTQRLLEEEVILNSTLFKVGARLYKFDTEVKVGEFEIIRGMSMLEILELITGENSKKYDLYVKDCITNWELRRLLESKYYLINDLNQLTFIEGVYAPDTYRLSYNTKASEVVDLMRSHQSKIIDFEWRNRQQGLPLKNKNELLILASIVEKEAANISEMPRVASVFINRLNKEMRLQSDPTVMFGMDNGNINIRKKLVKSDLKSNTAFNTYRISGLPPTSICNPSRKAIHSVANPEDTNFLYFVLTNSNVHAFSTSFKEHNAKVIRFRRARGR